MRCQKSKRVCPGYRDASELKLRDESKSAKKKLARRLRQESQMADGYGQTDSLTDLVHHSYTEPGSLLPTVIPSRHRCSEHSRNTSMSTEVSQTSFTNSNNYLASVHDHHQSHISAHISTPLHQQAACYFLAHFVMVSDTGTSGGHFDFLLPLMKKSNSPQPLLTAFYAVALAALGTRPNSKSLLPKADLLYVKALKEINVALKDPRVGSSNSTLASAMLLARFEVSLVSCV